MSIFGNQSPIETAYTRCELACESEAQALGFEAKVGRQVMESILDCDTHAWSDEANSVWMQRMTDEYGNREALVTLLRAQCCKLLDEYMVMVDELAKNAGI